MIFIANKLLKNSIIFILLICIIITIVIYIYSFVKLSPLNIDGGHYLSYSRLLSQKYSLFENVTYPYAPFGLWTYSLFYPVFQETYQNYFIVTIAFTFLSGILLYLISREVGISKLVSLLMGLYLFTFSISYGGASIVIEPFSVFWGLLCILTLLLAEQKSCKTLYYLSGVLLFISFMSKQYGILIFPGCVYLILTQNRISSEIFNNLFYFILGLFLSIIIFAIFMYAHGVSLIDILLSFTGGKFGGILSTNNEIITVVRHKIEILQIFKSVGKYVIKIIPLIILSVVVLLKNRQLNNRKIKFIIIMMLFSSLPLLYARYSHYFLLITPYAIIFTILVIREYYAHISKNKIIILLIIVCLIIPYTFFIRSIIVLNNSTYQNKSEQMKISNQLKEYIPENSKVLLNTDYPLYFINNYQYINKLIGYSFHIDFNSRGIQKMLPVGAFYVYRQGDIDISRYEKNYKKIIIKDTNPKGNYIVVLEKVSHLHSEK